MVDEFGLLLSLHLRRMLPRDLAHLRGWCLLAALYDMWYRGQCTGRALQSGGLLVGMRACIVGADIWQIVVLNSCIFTVVGVKASLGIVVLRGDHG